MLTRSEAVGEALGKPAGDEGTGDGEVCLKTEGDEGIETSVASSLTTTIGGSGELMCCATGRSMGLSLVCLFEEEEFVCCLRTQSIKTTTAAMATGYQPLTSSGPTSKLLHYIILSVPVMDGDKDKAYQEHKARTADLGASFRFEIPDLASGTLDSLMNLSDELAKTDAFVEGTCRKIVQTLTEIVSENPQWSVTRAGEQVTPDEYLSTFKWDEKKYPWKVHLKEIVARINAVSGLFFFFFFVF